MSDPVSAPYEEMHAWLLSVQRKAEIAMKAMEPKVVDRIERDVLADRARRAMCYLAVLADRLELFDA